MALQETTIKSRRGRKPYAMTNTFSAPKAVSFIGCWVNVYSDLNNLVASGIAVSSDSDFVTLDLGSKGQQRYTAIPMGPGYRITFNNQH